MFKSTLLTVLSFQDSIFCLDLINGLEGSSKKNKKIIILSVPSKTINPKVVRLIKTPSEIQIWYMSTFAIQISLRKSYAFYKNRNLEIPCSQKNPWCSCLDGLIVLCNQRLKHGALTHAKKQMTTSGRQ